ncbi:MAG: hypothetical protein ACREV8_16735, partial [Gammaproteobacteria bacterium]
IGFCRERVATSSSVHRCGLAALFRPQCAPYPALAEFKVFPSLSSATVNILSCEPPTPSHLSAGFFQTLLSLAG